VKDVGLCPDELQRIRDVFRRAPDVIEVRLYGSRAKGISQPGSDIDLALVGVRDRLRAEAIAEELEELPLPYRFDVKAYDAIAYAPLREHIARVGVTRMALSTRCPHGTRGTDVVIAPLEGRQQSAVECTCWHPDHAPTDLACDGLDPHRWRRVMPEPTDYDGPRRNPADVITRALANEELARQVEESIEAERRGDTGTLLKELQARRRTARSA
jgi:predicted nucleotidyltransferase